MDVVADEATKNAASLAAAAACRRMAMVRELYGPRFSTSIEVGYDVTNIQNRCN